MAPAPSGHPVWGAAEHLSQRAPLQLVLEETQDGVAVTEWGDAAQS